jgi:hypothetical protein
MKEVGQLLARRDGVELLRGLAGDFARGWELRSESIGRHRSTLPHEFVVGGWPRWLLKTQLVAPWNFDCFLSLILESMLMYRAQWGAVILVRSLYQARHSILISNIFTPVDSGCIVCHMWR